MTLSIIDVISDDNLLGRFFEGSSWNNWRVVMQATFGLPMGRQERYRFRKLAERDPPPGRVREAWFAIGRRGGKDSICSAIATTAAVYGNFQRYVRPGERPVILCIASSKAQAGGLLSYIKAYFEHVPMLTPLVSRITDTSIELTNGIDIIVHSTNFRSIRGRTVALAIFNELAFWRDEAGGFANPDTELYSAVLPALMTLRAAGSMLIGISSVHRKQGLLYEKWREYHGKDDPNVLVIKAPSTTFNSTIEQSDIDSELALDPEKGRSEWYSEWRSDISDFIDRSLVEELIDRGVRERTPEPHIHYIAFADESGGSGQDASTLVIVHTERTGMIIQDVARRWQPRFSPEQVIREKADLLKKYHIHALTGDRWAGGIPPEMYEKHGIRFEQSAKPKSDLYLDFLHILNSRKIRLLDEPVQIAELCNLERRVTWGGKESISHAPNYHDDAANALAGAAAFVATAPAALVVTKAVLEASRLPAGARPRSLQPPQYHPAMTKPFSGTPQTFVGSASDTFDRK
jgi:hypothetical protein